MAIVLPKFHKLNIAYAGIGSRETPPEDLEVMQIIGEYAAESGFELRSGGAVGADQAFERGCDTACGYTSLKEFYNNPLKTVYVPWTGFNGYGYGDNNGSSIVAVNGADISSAMKLAEEMHPNWAACSQGVRKLHARNMMQILGTDLDDPVALVVCWTKDGRGGGGTGQALRLAESRGIPVIDLANIKGCSADKLNVVAAAMDNIVANKKAEKKLVITDRQEYEFERNMLEGNVNRLNVTDDITELKSVREHAIRNIDRIYNYRKTRLEFAKNLGLDNRGEATLDIPDCTGDGADDEIDYDLPF